MMRMHDNWANFSSRIAASLLERTPAMPLSEDGHMLSSGYSVLEGIWRRLYLHMVGHHLTTLQHEGLGTCLWYLLLLLLLNLHTCESRDIHQVSAFMAAGFFPAEYQLM